MNLDRHNRLNIAEGLRDIMRERHPDLTFEIGVLDRDGFRPFTAGTGKPVRLKPSGNKPVPVTVPNPDHTKEAA